MSFKKIYCEMHELLHCMNLVLPIDFRKYGNKYKRVIIGATLWSLLLPSVETTIYFHQQPEENLSISHKTKKAITLMKDHFVNSFSQATVVKWSLWYAVSSGTMILTQFYFQSLWKTIQEEAGEEDKPIYNGAVDAVMTLASFLATVAAGFAKLDWGKYGELSIAVCSFLQGANFYMCSQATAVWVSYLGYVILGILHYFMITITSVEMAKRLKEDTYGLVFGFSTLLAVVLQMIFIVLFIDKTVFALKVRDEYLTLGGYHLLISICYLYLWFWSYCRSKRKSVNLT